MANLTEDTEGANAFGNLISNMKTQVNPRPKNAKFLDWRLDSAPGRHLRCQQWMFSQYKAFNIPLPMNGVGQGAFALGQGQVPIVVQRTNNTHKIVLTQVLYVPYMTVYLISIGMITNRPGYDYTQNMYDARITFTTGRSQHLLLQGIPHGASVIWSTPSRNL